MQPQTQTRQDGFTPKWRVFHPMDRVWLQNPFDHDVIFQVADEHNRPFRYRLPAHQVSELPGGAIATLGVKAVVDELISNTSGDEMRMWDANVRGKHEKDIILRIKQTQPLGDSSTPGEVNLAVKSDEVPANTVAAPSPPEEAFPGLNEPATTAPTLANSVPIPDGLRDVVNASLPSSDAVVGANNAGHKDEG